ncbi:uncharacterized protein FIESC28_02925 [Fusarium coffeatum]|uniref:FAD dependent oxidoreductase domain-containing protein n=1 Tax=Fusarium coffeatum TaxID=231269 RepID=A0A366S712_9HYPO|nr:uncharacterized protein FIESC28_02925 [Fusarium coffeatum]RBR24435.1 hypothetical protein FIESC28_02925 [Fusarium coffeatum]
MNSHSVRIVIVGAGTFGLSTAYHLGKSGYQRVVCLDRWPYPSPSSAGYDLNKIMRTEYPDDVYTKLSHEALNIWRKPMFSGIYNETGWLFCTDGTTEQGRVQAFDQSVENTKQSGDASQMVELTSWEETVAMFPFLGNGKVGDNDTSKELFRAIFNKNAGWIDSVKAMELIGKECEGFGHVFHSGDQGTVVKILRDGSTGQVTGVQARDGTMYEADIVILAMGAYSDTLLDYERQLEATAYAVTHIKLSEEQYKRYKDMPIINITDTSYLNSRDSQARTDDWGSKSFPRDSAYHPTDTQPLDAQRITQRFLKWMIPELAAEKIHSSRLCWDTECKFNFYHLSQGQTLNLFLAHDSNWIIGPHPSSPKSLFVATGGSGYSFKNFVNIGSYIVEMLEGKLDPELQELWRWRPDRVGQDAEIEARSRRPKLELSEAEGWNHDHEVNVHRIWGQSRY